MTKDNYQILTDRLILPSKPIENQLTNAEVIIGKIKAAGDDVDYFIFNYLIEKSPLVAYIIAKRHCNLGNENFGNFASLIEDSCSEQMKSVATDNDCDNKTIVEMLTLSSLLYVEGRMLDTHQIEKAISQLSIEPNKKELKYFNDCIRCMPARELAEYALIAFFSEYLNDNQLDVIIRIAFAYKQKVDNNNKDKIDQLLDKLVSHHLIISAYWLVKQSLDYIPTNFEKVELDLMNNIDSFDQLCAAIKVLEKVLLRQWNCKQEPNTIDRFRDYIISKHSDVLSDKAILWLSTYCLCKSTYLNPSAIKKHLSKDKEICDDIHCSHYPWYEDKYANLQMRKKEQSALDAAVMFSSRDASELVRQLGERNFFKLREHDNTPSYRMDNSIIKSRLFNRYFNMKPKEAIFFFLNSHHRCFININELLHVVIKRTAKSMSEAKSLLCPYRMPCRVYKIENQFYAEIYSLYHIRGKYVAKLIGDNIPGNRFVVRIEPDFSENHEQLLTKLSENKEMVCAILLPFRGKGRQEIRAILTSYLTEKNECVYDDIVSVLDESSESRTINIEKITTRGEGWLLSLSKKQKAIVLTKLLDAISVANDKTDVMTFYSTVLKIMYPAHYFLNSNNSIVRDIFTLKSEVKEKSLIAWDLLLKSTLTREEYTFIYLNSVLKSIIPLKDYLNQLNISNEEIPKLFSEYDFEVTDSICDSSKGVYFNQLSFFPKKINGFASRKRIENGCHVKIIGIQNESGTMYIAEKE